MSLKQTGPIRKYVKAIFRSSPWTFLIWRKRTGSSISWRGFNLRQNVQDLGAKQAASLLDWKYLAKGGRDQAKGKGKGLKYRKKARTPRRSQAWGQEKRAQDQEPKRTEKKEERLHLLQAPKEVKGDSPKKKMERVRFLLKLD